MNVLMEMGHGDELVLADANFPAADLGKRIIYASGHGVPVLLEAVLKLIPLDIFVEKPVLLMQTGPQFPDKPPVWDAFRDVISGSDEAAHFSEFDWLDRFDFYERTRKAFAVVSTSETSLYANIILKKGVVIK
jgi:L-fucose mutarotase